jgi:hypothetical protein
MNESVEPKATPSMPALTAGDKFFVGIMVLVLFAVTGLGMMALNEGHKTEGSKRNAEALAEWMIASNASRFNADYAVAACAGSATPASVTEAQSPQIQANASDSAPQIPADASGVTSTQRVSTTWGDCLAYLQQQSPLKDLRNPFTGQTPKFEAACSGADYKLAGALVLEKRVPTPAGSAISHIPSQLIPTDSISEELQLRLTVCDKGGYGIKVGEFEF